MSIYLYRQLYYGQIVNRRHPLVRGLIDWWQVLPKLSGTLRLTNIARSLNHGVLTNGPTWAGSPRFGAVNFDGVNDFVDCGSGASLALTGECTMMGWVYTPSAGTAKGFFGQASATAYGQGDFGANSSGQFSVHWGDVTIIAGTIPYTAGWHFIGFTRSGVTGNWTAIIYEDAKNVDSLSGVTTNPGTQRVFEIGRNNNAAAFLTGRVESVMQWTRALSASEVMWLYRDTKEKYSPMFNYKEHRISSAAAAAVPFPPWPSRRFQNQPVY